MRKYSSYSSWLHLLGHLQNGCTCAASGQWLQTIGCGTRTDVRTVHMDPSHLALKQMKMSRLTALRKAHWQGNQGVMTRLTANSLLRCAAEVATQLASMHEFEPF